MEILNEIQKMRKVGIKSHFEKILRKAKSSKQINGFYSCVINGLIITILEAKGEYNYSGFTFYKDDILLLNLILKEHNLKNRILNKLTN